MLSFRPVHSSASHLASMDRPLARRSHGFLWALAAGAALLLQSLPAAPATAQIPGAEGKAKLVMGSERTAYEAGSTARLVGAVSIDPGWHIQSHKPSFEYLIPTVLEVELPAGWPAASLQYPKDKMWTAGFADGEALAVYEGEVKIRLQLEVPEDLEDGSVPLRGVLKYQACDDRQCLPPTTTEATLDLGIGSGGVPTPWASEATAPLAGDGRSLGLMLFLALLGGLILNGMPCVLPVLSLKVFGLVKSAGQGRGEVVAGSLSTAAGILISFWALALAAVLARLTGQTVGWGVQFQNPGFVAFLILVVTLFCLNLWGLFEVPLPGRLANLADSGSRRGVAGHFTSGLFATLMATPCSAPFLGTALGFGLAQEAPVIVGIFTAAGMGMALPYIVLAVVPGAAAVLPKPGPWMEYLKGVMGFLLAGAAVWLLYVLAAQVSPERVAVLQLGLLVLALFTWLQSRAADGSWTRRVSRAGIGVVCVAVVAVALGGSGSVQGRGSGETASLIPWTDFDRGRAEGLAAEGRLVFVDVTADWCWTCKVNERLVLETREVAEAFRRHEVIAMKADWTNRNDAIGEYLKTFGRASIPFYLLYRPTGEPHLFGELLTKGAVLKVLEESGVRRARAGPS